MSTHDSGQVVVGVKTASAGMPAVRLGAREAALRTLPLHIVHAFVWPPFAPPDAAHTGYGSPHQKAQEIIDAAMSEATAVSPELVVSGDIIDSRPVPALLDLAERATVLILGNDTLTTSVSMPVESVAVQLAARAHCPVVVAAGSERTHGPVVVGVDGSPATTPTLELALEEAALRDTELMVVHAYETDRETQQRAAALLIDAITPLRSRYPTVRVEHHPVAQPARQTLREQSREAQLLVVGARGWQRRLLGSVTQAMLHHANCAVAVSRVR